MRFIRESVVARPNKFQLGLAMLDYQNCGK